MHVFSSSKARSLTYKNFRFEPTFVMQDYHVPRDNDDRKHDSNHCVTSENDKLKAECRVDCLIAAEIDRVDCHTHYI